MHKPIYSSEGTVAEKGKKNSTLNLLNSRVCAELLAACAPKHWTNNVPFRLLHLFFLPLLFCLSRALRRKVAHAGRTQGASCQKKERIRAFQERWNSHRERERVWLWRLVNVTKLVWVCVCVRVCVWESPAWLHAPFKTLFLLLPRKLVLPHLFDIFNPFIYYIWPHPLPAHFDPLEG